jgi:hypothetical protein
MHNNGTFQLLLHQYKYAKPKQNQCIDIKYPAGIKVAVLILQR